MNEVFLLSKTEDGKKVYLRYGMNGGGIMSYCTDRGFVVAFNSHDAANDLRNAFTRPIEWDIERFTK